MKKTPSAKMRKGFCFLIRNLFFPCLFFTDVFESRRQCRIHRFVICASRHCMVERNFIPVILEIDVSVRDAHETRALLRRNSPLPPDTERPAVHDDAALERVRGIKQVEPHAVAPEIAVGIGPRTESLRTAYLRRKVDAEAALVAASETVISSSLATSPTKAVASLIRS